MARKALITGVTGQDGAYLAQLLLKKGYEIYGMVRRTSSERCWRLFALGIQDNVRLLPGDMTDELSLNSVVRFVMPDEVYNLAGLSFVQASWDQPVLTSEVNGIGVLRLLNAIRLHCPSAKFYQASTSEMYGNGDGTRFAPCSPYGVSKLFAHQTTINYRETYGMFACCGILFNHESPLRGMDFVTRKVAHEAVRIARGKSDKMAVGNLHSRRDWGYAPEFVEAMWMMLQRERPEDFVVATGETHSVLELIQEAFSYVGIENVRDHIYMDDALLRPLDVRYLGGKPTLPGWEPQVKFKELVKILVEAEGKSALSLPL